MQVDLNDYYKPEWLGYSGYNQLFGGGSGGLLGSGTGFGLPGVGGNGAGENGIYYDWVSGTFRYVSNPGRVVIGGFWLDVPISEKVNEGLDGEIAGRWIIGAGIRSIFINPGFGEGSFSSSGGNHGIDDYVGLAVSAVGAYNGFMGDAFYSKYHHVQKNGTIRSAKFVKNNANKIYQTSRDGVKALTKNARVLSRGAGIVGSAISVGQFVYEPTIANAFDGVMSATAFIPVVGWAVSGTYFILNTFTTATTGQTIGEHIFGDKRVF